jgi:tetratricopeptide (TPR) repeat protein
MSLAGTLVAFRPHDCRPGSRGACRRTLRLLGVAVGLGLMAWGCAPKAPPVAPGAPTYPEFVFPAVPPDLVRGALPKEHQTAWRQLQAGDARGALRAFDRIGKQSPAFYPASAGAGWAALASKDPKLAVAAFDRALQRAPQYAPALAGRGEALLQLKDERAALEAFEAALAADPGLADVRRRVEVLRFRGLEEQLTAARQARDAGRADEARAAYQRALALSPDSPLVYRELADVERTAGDLAPALEHAQAAARLDPSDPSLLVLVGEIHESRGEAAAAIEAYQKAQAMDASPEVAERIDILRRRAALAQLPQQYRDLGTVARLTRGDLAALLGIRLESVVKTAQQRQGVVLTDVRGHWAASWINAVARAGLMQPYANHTFQPKNAVRRGEFALAVNRALTLIGGRAPRLAEAWAGKRLTFPDLGGGHAMYAAASAAVASGVMLRLENEAFGPSAVISGADAIAAVDRLQALASRAGFPRADAGGAR